MCARPQAAPACAAPGSASGAASKRAEPNAELMLAKLREHILEKGAHAPRRAPTLLPAGAGHNALAARAGGPWEEGWRVEKKQRSGGTSAGTWDAVRLPPAASAPPRGA